MKKQTAWYKLNRDKARDSVLRRLYGISLEGFNKILKTQGGVCAICKGPPTKKGFMVDHDHKTGKVRGILCHHCNAALGALRDSQVIVASALDYLANFEVQINQSNKEEADVVRDQVRTD